MPIYNLYIDSVDGQTREKIEVSVSKMRDLLYYLSNPQHCQCNTSKFCYEPHGHVITGDLMVIGNVKLRELVAKGPKYREPNKINWKSTKTMVLDSTDFYAEQWFKREQVDLKYLPEWKDRIKELVVERISSLKGKIRSPKQKILNDPDVKDTPRRLHCDFLWYLQIKLPTV